MMIRYYKCEWVIRLTKDFYRLTEQHSSNYAFHMLDEPSINEADFFIYTFVLRVADKMALREFEEKIGSYLGTGEWSATTENEFQKGFGLHEYWNNISGPEQGAIIDTYVMYAKANEVKIDKRDEPPTVIFFSCDWKIDNENINLFKQADQVANSLNILILSVQIFLER